MRLFVRPSYVTCRDPIISSRSTKNMPPTDANRVVDFQDTMYRDRYHMRRRRVVAGGTPASPLSLKCFSL